MRYATAIDAEPHLRPFNEHGSSLTPMQRVTGVSGTARRERDEERRAKVAATNAAQNPSPLRAELATRSAPTRGS
jgi:hypothetical protein